MKVIKWMLVEEVLDDKERAKKELSCAMSAITETDKKTKRIEELSVAINHYKFSRDIFESHRKGVAGHKRPNQPSI